MPANLLAFWAQTRDTGSALSKVVNNRWAWPGIIRQSGWLLLVAGLALLASVVMTRDVNSASRDERAVTDVLLTIEAAQSRRDDTTRLTLDYQTLREIGWQKMVIHTDWTPQGAMFEGVPARALIEWLGLQGNTLHGIAHDDYEVAIPMADLLRHNMLFAVRMNGKRMSIREKGPIWLLYPDDSRPDISDALLNARMIWQLHTLVIK